MRSFKVGSTIQIVPCEEMGKAALESTPKLILSTKLYILDKQCSTFVHSRRFGESFKYYTVQGLTSVDL